MPGPAIYVAVAVGAVAAVIVFKEFVYDPHFRPRFSAWRESRQRRRARPHTVSPSSPSHSEGGDGSRLSQRSTRGGDNSGIRLRRVGESQNRPVGNQARSLNTDPTQSLISLDDSSTSHEIPNNRLSELVDLTPPTPLAAETHTQHGDAADPSRSPLSPQTSDLVGMPHVPETAPLSGPGNSTMETRSSTPDTDFLSPSDILSGDQYLAPHDQTLSPQRVHGIVSPTLSSDMSVDFLSSPAFSPPGSPFVDAGTYYELVESRRGVAASEIPSGAGPSLFGIVDGTPPPGAGLLPIVRADSEIFSLPSQVSSDMSSDEGDYDSILESELSNWTSDVADGERAAQR